MDGLILFQVSEQGKEELYSQSMAIEKSLQQLFEKILEQLLGVRFVAPFYFILFVSAIRIKTKLK